MKTVEEARAARDEVLARLDAVTDPEWKDMARLMLIELAETRAEFFADDLWATGLPWPKSARAAGSIWQWGAQTGLIEKTGEGRPSVHSNLSEKPVWRSLIYEEAS